MIQLIILLCLAGIGIYILTRNEYSFPGFFMTFIFSIWAVIHLIVLTTVKYEYMSFITQRNSFEKTLKDARENGYDIETVGITERIADWNMSLTRFKYKNKTIYFDQFVDDRFDSLEPIR